MCRTRVVLDTDCISALFSPREAIHDDMCRVEELRQEGKVDLYTSRKSLDQLAVYPGPPFDYAQSLGRLPNFPVGSWDDQVDAWDTMAGNWDDACDNEMLQQKIHQLTNAGVNIRDRQIVVDSIRAGMHVLLTNDRGLRDPAPATRLKEVLGFEVMAPGAFLSAQLWPCRDCA